jgi:multidrug efflux pump subunit AcrB
VGLNSSPDSIEKLNAIPIKSLPNGTTVYLRDVANIVNGSIPQTNNAENFWADPKNGVRYQVNAQVPQYEMNSLDALRNLPILGGIGQGQILANALGRWRVGIHSRD